jgi:hypothetical protein
MATKEPAEKIDLPEIRLITQAECNSLDEMVNAVCTKVLGPDWEKKGPPPVVRHETSNQSRVCKTRRA